MDGQGSVIVKSLYSASRIGSNGAYGLIIQTNGPVSLIGGKYGIAANNNGLSGAPYLDGININNMSAPVLRAVTLQNVTSITTRMVMVSISLPTARLP